MPLRGDQVGSIFGGGLTANSASSVFRDSATAFFFGSGLDGDVTVTGTVTLSRDMEYRNLTVAKNAIVRSNGFSIRVHDTLLVDGDSNSYGLISNNGSNARNSIAGVGEVSSSVPAATLGAPFGTLFGGGAGGAGFYNGGQGVGNTLHAAGSPSTNLVPAVALPTSASYYSLGGSGGNGGDCFYAGGSGALATAPSSSGGWHSIFTITTGGVIGLLNGVTGTFSSIGGGAGGGAGACYNSGTVGVLPRSGWGGGGGGVIRILARNVNLRGRIEARGGNGGNTFAYAAGGGGGGGGVVMLGYSQLAVRTSIAEAISVAGGLPGTGYTLSGSGVAGNAPMSGYPGTIFTFEI